jgi:hypothetical protein
MRALQLRIGEGEMLAAGATRNPDAYEAYLRRREAADGEESGARQELAGCGRLVGDPRRPKSTRY